MEHAIYLYSAIIGGTLVGLQVVLQVFGLMGDTDFDGHDVHDAHVDGSHDGAGHGNIFFGVLSFKALCAFAGIFGLVGLMVFKGDMNAAARIGTAFGSGVAGMFVVGWMMRGLSRLQASGTINMRNAVGRTATVYLAIPEKNSGMGKVTVEIQGQSLEIPASTDGEAIGTGSRVTVVAVEGDETLKVVPI